MTLDLVNAPAETAFAELTRQTGVRFWPYYRLDFDWRQQPPVTVRVQDAPLWDALDAVLVAARMHATRAEQEIGVLELGLNASPRQDQSVVTGPFLVERSFLNNGGTGAEGIPASDMHLDIRICPEPKISVVGGVIDNRPSIAVDENGMSLLGREFRQRVNVLTPAQGCFQARALIARPPGVGQKLARVAGTVPIYLEVATASGVVPRLRPEMDHGMDVGGLRFRILGFRSHKLGEPFRTGATGYEVVGHVLRDGRTAEEWKRLDHFFHALRLRVTDSSGRKVNKGNGNITLGDDRISFAIPCEPLYTDEFVGEPHTLTVEVPTAVTRAEVRYEFRNLRLPEPDE